MPKVTTLEFDRTDLDELLAKAEAAGDLEWGEQRQASINATEIVMERSAVVDRVDFGELVEVYEPDAAGCRAKVTALGSKGAKVKLTREGDGDGEKAQAEEKAEVEAPGPAH